MSLRKMRPTDFAPAAGAKDTAIMVEILTGLAERDRDAALSFYCDGKTEPEIEATLGVGMEHLRDLRRSLKAAFCEKRSRYL